MDLRSRIALGKRVVKSWRVITALAVGLLAAGSARAQFPGDVPDTFRLSAGGMYAWFSTDVTLQEDLTPGGPIGAGVDLQDAAGIPGSTGGFSARGYWQPLNRFYVDFGYTIFTRSNTRSLGIDIPFGDSTFTVGASTEAKMKSQLPYLDFRYNFIQNDAWRLGVSLGAAYSILDAELTASAGVVGPNGPIIGQSTTEKAELHTVVPLLGLNADFKLGDRAQAGIIFNGIFAPVHPYVGSVFVIEPHFDWFFTKNFGMGAAFDYTKFSIRKEENDIVLVNFRYSYYGPKLYLTVTF
jgi:hypothetical protein